MRNSFLILAITIGSITLFSCSTSAIEEEVSIEELATEGEDGEVNEDPDNPDTA